MPSQVRRRRRVQNISERLKGSACLPDDKSKLSELCLKSFKDSLGSLKVRMFVLLDDCPPSYEDLFKQIL